MINRFFRWCSGKRNEHDTPPRVGGIFGRMTPEAMCDIDPERMDSDEIRRRLSELYKRHNQAAGSLDPELRKEAEHMLEAIVHCREKYVGSVV